MNLEKEDGWLKRIHGSIGRNFVALVIVGMVLVLAILIFENWS